MTSLLCRCSASRKGNTTPKPETQASPLAPLSRPTKPPQLTTKPSQFHLPKPSWISSPGPPLNTCVQLPPFLCWTCYPLVSVPVSAQSQRPGEQVQPSQGLKQGGGRGRTEPSSGTPGPGVVATAPQEPHTACKATGAQMGVLTSRGLAPTPGSPSQRGAAQSPSGGNS